MHFKRDELIGIFVSLVVAVGIFAAVRLDLFAHIVAFMKKETATEAIHIREDQDMEELKKVLVDSFTATGKVTDLIIQDTKVGTSAEVQEGSRVTLHYIGRLQDGTQFDNSYERGEPYTFTVGAGSVIKGWDMGLVGMKVGGERVLVIPQQLGYGTREVGKIPRGATLLFAIELLKSE